MKSTIKKSLVALIAATVVLTVSLATATAQQQPPAESGKLVAVLDVAKVFENDATFKARMAQIKSEADQVKESITQQQEAIRKRAEGLSQYEIGSTERNNMEAQLAQEQAALQTKARQAEMDLLNREAGIYYETYKNMQTVVERLAQKFGIALVLRFDSTEIDPTNRPEVIQGVNRSVVYHSKLDLTKFVMDGLNPAQAQAQTPNNK